ncbi:helix-turn-helix transcriptional regulator [Kitasatospora purpeofusca]|uniref:helix-turn-helix domain-containing protein n=1 Tax=Kitasatospora purpeofusca TaxID=67352 RepID=UPI002A5A9DA5|nr:helix-turn-helix transcriptional regulator [Kitasatospora purpeofusca]MDY0812611.1 helix-turn-helix transcriptional regulator [Kitasatospora purpeofusca]
MASSGAPTLRQQRLGFELRKLRENAGLSSTAAAARVGVNQAHMSRIEAGRYAVSADRVRAFARAYTCTDQGLVEALAAMTGRRVRGWWEEYRDILPPGALDLAELEHHSTAMRIATVIHIPGLLQTVDHARAIFLDVFPPLSPPEVEHRVSHRIKRQAVLYGEQSIPLTAVIHEAALRMGLGGSAVARAQYRHLVEMSTRDNISVRVIPFGAGTFSGSGQSMVYFSAAVPQLDSVQLDTEHGSEFLDSYAHLVKYRLMLDRLESSALNRAESRDFISRIAQDI